LAYFLYLNFQLGFGSRTEFDSDEDNALLNSVVEEEEDTEGAFAFRRKRDCLYHSVSVLKSPKCLVIDPSVKSKKNSEHRRKHSKRRLKKALFLRVLLKRLKA